MERKSLRNLRDSYRNNDEYSKVVDIIWKNVEHKVRSLMEKNPQAVELERQMHENNKTYFDKENEIAFLVDYGFTDDNGEDYLDHRYSEELYNGYHDFIKNYDSTMKDLETQKQKIKDAKFIFGRAKKLEEIESKIKDKTRTYNYYMSIYEREKKFQETWFKDGKFVDLNKEHKEQLAEIRKGVVEKLVNECFEKYPELMMYDFRGTNFREDVLKAIDKEQKSRVLTTKKQEEPTSVSEEQGYEMQ
ncbi:MAG: hypothetical protein IJX17_06300 [Clostridia bacterium]|nr:hypothetical protein [Clostridia bacterium]